MIGHSDVPGDRIRELNDAPLRDDGDYVLYWMTANRRVDWNFALQRAVDRALELRRPLLVLEPLRADYRWASDRLHRFVMDGMAENSRRLDASGISYFPYIEPARDAGKGLLAGLAARASMVVTDDTPMFFYPRMLAAAAARVDVLLEGVDAAGLLPLRRTEKAYTSAHSFRRFLQRELPQHLERLPRPDPTSAIELPALATDPGELVPGFRPTTLEALEDAQTLADLPIDHEVETIGVVGGGSAARIRLHRFVEEQLPHYGEQRNHPDAEHPRRLSAYLHFGHLSSHEIFATVAAQETWSPAHLADAADGGRQGWWGMSDGSEAFLDQLVTWRELGFNMCQHRDDYDSYSSLPDWALTTLDEHRADERAHVYGLGELEAAATHDEVWNAAQTQLVREGRIHNYLRMLWGKKILEWSTSPEDALRVMIELNNKYALDGRDPNSYSGIFWVLGRYDRPWGPERPVFGKVRYMSSANTARKLRLKEYLQRYEPARSPEAVGGQ